MGLASKSILWLVAIPLFIPITMIIVYALSNKSKSIKPYPYNKHNDYYKQKYYKTYRNKRSATIIRIFRTIKSRCHQIAIRSKSDNSEHQENERTMARWTRRVGIFTVILSITAIISDVIYSFQYRAMLQANTDNREAYTSAQRAFLFVSDVKVVGSINDTGKKVLRVFPQWTNSGETTTKYLFTEIFCTNDKDLIAYKGMSGSTRDIIGPKQVKASGNCDAIPQKIDQSKAGVIYKFAVGAKATYFDVFDRVHEHITEFCAILPITQVSSDDGKTITISAGETIEYCPEHNCADDECPPEDRQ